MEDSSHADREKSMLNDSMKCEWCQFAPEFIFKVAQ